MASEMIQKRILNSKGIFHADEINLPWLDIQWYLISGLLIHSQARSSKSWSSKSCPLYISSYWHRTNSWNSHIIHTIHATPVFSEKCKLPHAEGPALWAESHLTCFSTIYGLLGFLHSWRNLMAKFIPKSSRIAHGSHFFWSTRVCATLFDPRMAKIWGQTPVKTPAKQPLPEVPSEKFECQSVFCLARNLSEIFTFSYLQVVAQLSVSGKKSASERVWKICIYIYIHVYNCIYIYIYVYSSMPCSVIDDSILSREASRPWGRNTAVKFAHREQHWCLPRDVSSLPSNTEATYYYGFKHIPVTSWNNHVWQKSPVSSERFLCRKFEIPLRNSPPDFSLH